VTAELVEVAVPVPLRRTFTYRVPTGLAGKLAPASRVAVPFGGRKLSAFVLGEGSEVSAVRTKDVAGLLDAQPVFTKELLAFLREAADYYLHPLGEVLRAAAPALPTEGVRALRADGFLAEGETLPGAAVATRRTLVVSPLRPPGAGAALAGADTSGTGPPASDAPVAPARLGKNQRLLLQLLAERREIDIDELRRHVRNPRALVRALVERGWAATREREVAADRYFADSLARDTPPVPTEAQGRAIATITARLDAGGAFLLDGVTGSGKTEVYLRVIAQARVRGRGALVLVPEIALTPQLVSRFRARFGDAIAVLHSELGARERYDAWRALRDGRVTLAIGARSALFAPVRDLGVVVVDEEHDPSFKQEEGFRYHARDMALLRAHRAGALCVLGSATPSLESVELAERGKLVRLRLEARATERSLPPVEIVDLRRHKSGPSGQRFLTAPLHRALEACLDAGDQAILFLNRRGFSPSVRCETCGEAVECPACSVALTLHRGVGLLRCHYCDHAAPPGASCAECGARTLVETGLGTEQLETTLRAVFPGARVGRLDRDTASGRGVEDVIERLRTRAIDILVGTQMVTKGHDIPGVTLVGVIAADQSLAFPDFRAAERTFQLLTQVAGRAGRGAKEGRVILQTFQPEASAVRFAAAHDFAGFAESELPARREHGYPPFGRLVAVRVDAGHETRAREVAARLAAVANRHPEVRAGRVRVLGPAPAPIERLRGRWRQRVMLLASDRRRLRAVAVELARRIDEGVAPARASLDVDPVSMM
jgi:primosomal protein N' (replication factor Y)